MNVTRESPFHLRHSAPNPLSGHVEEFKKTLSAEVTKSIKELGKMREEKRALEHQIADLFALKAKFGGDVSVQSRCSYLRRLMECSRAAEDQSRRLQRPMEVEQPQQAAAAAVEVYSGRVQTSYRPWRPLRIPITMRRRLLRWLRQGRRHRVRGCCLLRQDKKSWVVCLHQ